MGFRGGPAAGLPSTSPLRHAHLVFLFAAQPPLHAVLKGITLFFILAIASVAGGVSWWLLEAQELSAARALPHPGPRETQIRLCAHRLGACTRRFGAPGA